MPIYVFYLSGADKNILVDTGLEQFVVPDGAEEQCGYKILEFEDALATLGLRPEDIDIIIHKVRIYKLATDKHGRTRIIWKW